MKPKGVIFKGTGRTLKVVLSEGADLEAAIRSIEAKLASNPSFYAGQRITVESKDGPIPDDASDSIRRVFVKFGLACSVYDRRSAAEKAAAMITQTMLSDEGISAADPDRSQHEPVDYAEVFKGDAVPGKQLSFEGSVLILGDVLPGAKVTAGGDIIVTGIAGGTLRAGWPEDGSARIISGGFASANCSIGGISLRIDDAVGGAMTMYSLSASKLGLTMRKGDAGMLSKEGRGI